MIDTLHPQTYIHDDNMTAPSATPSCPLPHHPIPSRPPPKIPQLPHVTRTSPTLVIKVKFIEWLCNTPTNRLWPNKQRTRSGHSQPAKKVASNDVVCGHKWSGPFSTKGCGKREKNQGSRRTNLRQTYERDGEMVSKEKSLGWGRKQCQEKERKKKQADQNEKERQSTTGSSRRVNH